MGDVDFTLVVIMILSRSNQNACILKMFSAYPHHPGPRLPWSQFTSHIIWLVVYLPQVSGARGDADIPLAFIVILSMRGQNACILRGFRLYPQHPWRSSS